VDRSCTDGKVILIRNLDAWNISRWQKTDAVSAHQRTHAAGLLVVAAAQPSNPSVVVVAGVHDATTATYPSCMYLFAGGRT
jgi:succinylglutamate desuccinylase